MSTRTPSIRPSDDEPSDRPPKWWWYLAAALSLGLLGSRAGQRELAQALCDRARRKQNGEAAQPLTITTDFRGTTVNPARFELWAFWGFIVGVLDGVLTSTQGSPIHGMGSAIAEGLATGIGGSVLALFLAGLWNAAGRTR
jgi:hypothetical protein